MSYFIYKFNDMPDFIKRAGAAALTGQARLPIKREQRPAPSFLKEPFQHQEEEILKRIAETAQKKYPFKGEKKGLPLLTYLMEHPLEFVLETKGDFPEKWDWLKKDMLFLIEVFNLKLFSSNIKYKNIDYIWQKYYHQFNIISPENKRKMSAKLSKDEELFTEYIKKIKELFKLPEEPFIPEKNRQEYLENWLLKDLNKEKVAEIFQELNIKLKGKPVEENQGLLPF